MFNIDVHLKNIHEGKRPHKCLGCDLKFLTQNEFNKHIDKIHDGNRNFFECEYCDKDFASKETLSRHICENKIRKKEPCFECDTCGEKFHHKFRLRKHLAKVHEEIQLCENIQCGTCKLKFSNKEALLKVS